MNCLAKSLTNGFLQNVFKTNALKVFVRHFQRRPFIRRFGFVQKSHNRGLLPRVVGDVCPLRTVPNASVVDEWRPKAALFGQNDYIDILGDGSVSVTQLMTSTPYWLKGFKGNELQMLVRRRQAFKYWKWCRPKRWHHLNARIDFLYRKLNYKTKPPKPLYP